MTLLNCDLSFDPGDPYHPVPGAPGIGWAVQVFTTENGYGVDRSQGTSPEGSLRLARLGQQVVVPEGSVRVEMDRLGDSWTFSISAQHRTERIKSVKLILRGLPVEDLASGWWSPTTARDEVVHPPFQWSYPGPEWATRWAAAGRVSISVRDSSVAAAVLHVARPPYAAVDEVEIVHAVPAGEWAHSVTVPGIRLAIGSPATSFDQHYSQVRAAFGIPSWSDRPDKPAWMDDLELVVTLHGQHWTGHVFHTFDEMVPILGRVAERIDPSRVLVYLPGWEGRYYHEYPHYHPGEELGGDVGFRRLTSFARSTGFHLMPMFGANGANVARYPEWERAAIRNPTDRYPVMLNSPDWDGDRFPEGDQVFLNPGEPGFRAHLVDSISRVVDRYAVDAAFLDTASFWFDDPRFPLYEGYRELAAELRARQPHLLLASEGWWDAMTALFPLSQQWLGVPRDIRIPRLLTAASRTTGHLAEGTPGAGGTGVHEQGFRAYRQTPRLEGHLPSLSFAGGDGDAQLNELDRIARSSDPVGAGD